MILFNRGGKVPIKYKIDVMHKLREKGYTSYRLRKERIIGESYLQQIREGEVVSKQCLEKLCELLECNIGDIIEYVKE